MMLAIWLILGVFSSLILVGIRMARALWHML